MSDHYASDFYGKGLVSAYRWCATKSANNQPMIPITFSPQLEDYGYNVLRASTDAISGEHGADSAVSIVLVDMIHSIRSSLPSNSECNSKPHRRLCRGDAVQVLCRAGTSDNLIIDAIDSNTKVDMEHEAHRYLILSIYQVNKGSFWSIVVKLEHAKDNH